MDSRDTTPVVPKQQSDAKEARWAETIRRCEDAVRHPERMVEAEGFFRGVRADIELLRGKLGCG